MKHIGFAKIGKSLKFVTPFSPIGGDNEGPAMIQLLANHNPDKKFYLIGRSDFSKMTEHERLSRFPYNNVIDLHSKSKIKSERDYVKNRLVELSVEIDHCVWMVGQVGNVSIPNRIQQIKDPSQMTTIIDMTLGYTTPISEWWNDSKCPAIEIINDPRYTLAQSRDIIPNPIRSLSQFNGSYVKRTIRSYEDQTRDSHTINMTYSGVERVFLYGRGGPEKSRDRSVQMAIVLNEGDPSRYDMLNDWILKKVDDVEIYGRWEHPKAEADTRFKGALKLEQVQKKMLNVKYTFIISIANGWATSKYIEMIHAGVVPFFHPNYATNIPEIRSLVPDILLPKTPEDLFKGITKLEETGSYSRMIDHLQKIFCKPSDYSGETLNDTVMKALDENYIRPDLSEYSIEESSNSIDEFFQ